MPTFVETYRATVAPKDCDHLGHMNVQHYFAAVSDGMFALIRLGLPPRKSVAGRCPLPLCAQRRISTANCAGDVVALESTVLKVGEKSATFQHRLRHVAN
jgi:acyl-CoA thioester hydrolase